MRIDRDRRGSEEAVGGFASGLGADELRELRLGGRLTRFRRGQTLFSQGDLADRVALITAGRVKVCHVTEDGREIVLAIRGVGDVVGELAVLDGGPRSATVAAFEPLEAIIVTAAEFRYFLGAHPAVAWRLTALVADRMRASDRKRVEAACLDASARVARTLSELAGVIGEPSVEGSVTLAVSQRELAGYVGASREAVSRALRPLRDSGLIITSRRRLKILRLGALRAY